ncbi:hypothetical protein Cgig2_013449 [Carnegiea gigantea]|uniref:Uncharacterized protein n=1 Tax=Carnegiea gigantea TaxID=171969 RepID=A0A9Q1QBR8_9CARY|nr:hypothetical protein Cgig2_013449 [Carnegiea gigantea]
MCVLLKTPPVAFIPNAVSDGSHDLAVHMDITHDILYYALNVMALKVEVIQEPGLPTSHHQGNYETLLCCTPLPALRSHHRLHDPLDFRHERFLTTHKDFDVRGQNLELTPFQTGRRVCFEISFALQAMQFTRARLLHGFEISTPSGEKVDMTEGLGVTNLKASPLEVVLIPHLPDKLYR